MEQDGKKNFGEKRKEKKKTGRLKKEGRDMRTLHPFIHMHGLKRTSAAIHHKSPVHTHRADNYSKGELKRIKALQNKEEFSFFPLHFASYQLLLNVK